MCVGPDSEHGVGSDSTGWLPALLLSPWQMGTPLGSTRITVTYDFLITDAESKLDPCTLLILLIYSFQALPVASI